MKPTILFVPGIWEGPTVFNHVCSLLQDLGFPTQTCTLPSTGTKSPGNPSMHDDKLAIRSVVQKLVEEEGKTVVLVCHSAGGFLGAAAIEGLAVNVRKEKGESGGVGKLVFLCAGLAPEGFEHGSLPFMDFDKAKGEMHCLSPSTTLFSDLSEQETQKWIKELQCQPSEGWDGTTKYCGWRDVPSVYLLCEGDKILPEAMQTDVAEMAGSEVVRCGAGHMVMLSMPEKVVEVIERAAVGL